jgi:demethylmenaquinone methyltransferase / 2-methoxy-6-polyprenyl-1,4-benzoquinol methylase
MRLDERVRSTRVDPHEAPGPSRSPRGDDRRTALDPHDGSGVAPRLFAPLPRRYDRLAAVLSLGQDRRWRRAVVSEVGRASPGLVLDVATGPAGVALEVERRTGARVVGVDLTEAMLRQGQRNVIATGAAGRISLALGRAEALPFADATFDALSFTYLLRYVDDPAATVAELARVVKPGGVVASLDFFVPPRRFWRAWWRLYTRAVLPVAGAITGGRGWFDVGRFLGPNIEGHYRRCSLAQTRHAWNAAGLDRVQVRLMSLGGGLVMWGERRRD